MGVNADGNFKVLAVKEFANSGTGTLTDSAAGDVLCDGWVQVSYSGTTYWIPLYNTKP